MLITLGSERVKHSNANPNPESNPKPKGRIVQETSFLPHISEPTVHSGFFDSILVLCHVNTFTPESDQCQISPAASPEILHHTVRRTWLFIAYSDER